MRIIINRMDTWKQMKLLLLLRWSFLKLRRIIKLSAHWDMVIPWGKWIIFPKRACLIFRNSFLQLPSKDKRMEWVSMGNLLSMKWTKIRRYRNYIFINLKTMTTTQRIKWVMLLVRFKLLLKSNEEEKWTPLQDSSKSSIL